MTEITNDDQLNRWNIFWLTITSLAIVIIFLQLQFDRINFNPIFLVILSLGIPFMLMIFQYRQLRKKKVFTAWTLIGILLFLSFFWLRSDSSLILKGGKNTALGLKNPLAFLIAYYAFRKISLKYYGTELIIPRPLSHYDPVEGRNINLIDFVATVSYWFILLVTSVY